MVGKAWEFRRRRQRRYFLTCLVRDVNNWENAYYFSQPNLIALHNLTKTLLKIIALDHLYEWNLNFSPQFDGLDLSKSFMYWLNIVQADHLDHLPSAHSINPDIPLDFDHPDHLTTLSTLTILITLTVQSSRSRESNNLQKIHHEQQFGNFVKIITAV